MRRLAMIALLAFPAALHAQAATVSPGMSHAQVVAALGEPVTARTASEYTYMFYRNDCGRACGMNDLVVLRRDSVIDAIFRSPSRRYTGTSSSPLAEVHDARGPRAARRARSAVRVSGHRDDAVSAAQRGASWSSRAGSDSAATRPHVPAPAPSAAKPQAAPAPRLKPAGATDTRPSVPAGEPAVRKAPAPSTTPVKPAPSTTPVKPATPATPAPKPAAKPAP